MYIPRSRVFWSVSLGHMSNDLFMAMGPVLLAFIGGVYMDIPPAQIGVAVSARQFLGGVSQPLFGWLSDKGSSRVLGAGGVFLTVAMLALSMLLAMTGNFWLMIVPFALSALGSGAFHPVGTAYSSHQASQHASTTTAYFFLFGQTGLAIGPALAGLLLGMTQTGGEGGSVWPIIGLAGVALPSVYLMSRALPNRRQVAALDAEDAAMEAAQPATPKPPVRVRPLLLLALLVALRGLAYPGSVAFIPVLFKLKGWSPAAYGGITSLFWLSSAVAGVVAGSLADRVGRRLVVIASLVLAVPVYFVLPTVDSWLAYLLVVLAGALVGGPHSIIVVLAQSLLPGRKGFASGVALGFIFGVGALGTLLIGYLADGVGDVFAGIGLEAAFQAIAVFVLASALVGFTLPGHAGGKAKRKPSVALEPEGAD